MQRRALSSAWKNLVLVLSAGAVVLSGSVWAAESLPVPKFSFINRHEDFYPPKARRLGLEGRVLLAFDIRANGKADNVIVVSSEDPTLDPAARALLGNLKFEVANGAAASEGRPYLFGVAFCLSPSSHPTTFDAGIEKITVAGSRVKGAPVNYPLQAGGEDECRK